MKVILDVNRPSSLSCFVQYCSSVEGFLSVQEMHPEDEFVINPNSREAYVAYMSMLTMKEFNDFCNEMAINKADYDAMMDFYQNVKPSPDPVHDEEDFIDELLAEDYYAELPNDYYETLRDAMPRP